MAENGIGRLAPILLCVWSGTGNIVIAMGVEGMAFSIEFVDDGRGVMQIGNGIVTGQELIDTAKFILEKMQQGTPVSYDLIDLSNIERFSASCDDIRGIARINTDMAKLVGKIEVAVVAPSDVAYGMARMWQVYVQSTGWDTYVFRNQTEAQAWLATQHGEARQSPIEVSRPALGAP